MADYVTRTVKKSKYDLIEESSIGNPPAAENDGKNNPEQKTATIDAQVPSTGQESVSEPKRNQNQKW